jgi:hypothetical protein
MCRIRMAVLPSFRALPLIAMTFVIVHPLMSCVLRQNLSVARMGFFYRTIFIISVKSTANEYIIYTVKNARNFPFGNQKAAEERQDIPLP